MIHALLGIKKMRFEIPPFETVRILVVGDVMLDRYWRGGTRRISPEAPVPVVNVQEIEERPGGAGNVALNLSALGCRVSLFSLVGDDNAADILEAKLLAAGVDSRLDRIPGIPTITKLRIIDKNQQLIRLDFEEEFHHIRPQHLFQDFQKELIAADAVILSDYGKGALVAVGDFIRAARKATVPVLVDPKNKDFSIYRGATVITPNLKEFEAVVGPCRTELEIHTKGMALLEEQDLNALLITRGEHGMTLLSREHLPLHLPTRAREVYDVTGAGDTVISLLSAAVAAGEELATAAMLANTGAGIVVQKMGVATVSVPELRRALQRQHASELGVLTEKELLIAVADARAHGETIVMTNGCFDILHPGHVAYLEEAKELGKRLIVAINDDASVSRLKGSDRPINSLEHRMSVLAALRAVDWVVSFSEDTPARLISRVLPDILVKGGDYKPEEIAGADCVMANGGQVKILQFMTGYATREIIKKIRKEYA
jgi:D-beta-D-heptose 7-phosphate kinase/D-beta-D-heptose 1-phosphate adenosyltransferase